MNGCERFTQQNVEKEDPKEPIFSLAELGRKIQDGMAI